MCSVHVCVYVCVCRGGVGYGTYENVCVWKEGQLFY